MSRANDSNSANAQFFIMYADAVFLNGKYTVVGEVLSGMEVVDKIKKGEPVVDPDRMIRVQVAAAALAEKMNEALKLCRELASDKRLDPIRGLIAFDTYPNLSQQRNSDFITNEQRPALDAMKEIGEKCRTKIAVANPQLWKIMEQIQPAPYAGLTLLYDKKITIGQYNTRMQEVLDKFRAALAERGH